MRLLSVSIKSRSRSSLVSPHIYLDPYGAVQSAVRADPGLLFGKTEQARINPALGRFGRAGGALYLVVNCLLLLLSVVDPTFPISLNRTVFHISTASLLLDG